MSDRNAQKDKSTVPGPSRLTRSKTKLPRPNSNNEYDSDDESSDVQRPAPLKFAEDKEARSKTGKTERDALDNVLYHVGEFGRYQKLLFISMMPFGFFYAFVYFVQMFITATPQHHWCRVPELAQLDMELRRNLTAPGAAEGGAYDKCFTYHANWSQVLLTLTPPDPGTPTVPCQHGWEFELGDIPYHTVVSERGWVCQYAEYAPMAQAIFFVGSIFGGLFFGWMADRFGRVPALVGSNLIGCIGGIATIYTTGLLDFAFCRFLVGMAFDNVFMMMYILVLEYVGPRQRTCVANLSIALFFGSGCLALPCLALWVANWRKLLWLTSLPMLAILVAPCTVPESARWLLTRGRVNEVIMILRKFETVNNKEIPEDVLHTFIISSRHIKQSTETIMTLMKSAPLRYTMFVMVFVYMASAVVFDGLIRMSESLGLDFFLTFTLTSVTEIPSVMLLLLVLDRWGRRTLTCVPLGIAGTLIIVAMFVSKGVQEAALAIVARFFINMSYNATIQWSTEMLPTGVRALGSSILHMSGYIATVMSPFIVFSERLWPLLPLLTLGMVSLLASGASLVLPETRGRAMPQTIADGERIVLEHSLCRKSRQDDNEVPRWKTDKVKGINT